jgi:type II secretory pathway component PulC
MSKAIPALALLCGFLLGVIAGPWLWPPDLLAPLVETAPVPPPVAVLPRPPPPPPPPPPPEPELVLKGIFVASDPGRARALIARGDESPRLYKPDEKLPDGSVLRVVNSKDVEIEKNGAMRTLPLDRGTPATDASEPAEAAEPVEEAEVPEQPAPAPAATDEPANDQTPAPAAEDTAITP